MAVVEISHHIDGNLDKRENMEVKTEFIPEIIVNKFPEGGTLLAAGFFKKYAEVLIGNEVFIFGYPTSIGIKNVPQIDYTRPLLRKGIIAGKNEDKKNIILDCPVYYGNSGGPVVEVEEEGGTIRKFRVVGIISQFVPFEQEWFNLQHGYTNKDLENSGYSIATPLDAALELINDLQASSSPRTLG